MASKAATKERLPPIESSEAATPSSSPILVHSSSELGSPSKFTQYNKQTGRPMRKSAGKVLPVAGFVDSSILDDEDITSMTSESSEEESDDDDDVDDIPQRGRTRKAKAKLKNKRKRSPSPPSPRLDPIIYNQEVDTLTDDESSGAFHRHTPKKTPLVMNFMVPLGFHGPLSVRLDRSLLHAEQDGKFHEMHRPEPKQARVRSPSPKLQAAPPAYKGFTDLPPELRNKIYRLVFICPDRDLRIPPQRDNNNRLMRSSQFLRTCKLVHNEGCSILYGENTFLFNRHFNTRGPFWENIPKEIGYQDVLQFLKMIGAENLQYLRDIKFVFDDALPRDTPYLDMQAHEKRRYLNDEYLINCLRILRHAKLRKLLLRFIGRRSVLKTDIKFLGYLEQIKADEVEQFSENEFCYPPQKIGSGTWSDLQDLMIRKKRLYEKK